MAFSPNCDHVFPQFPTSSLSWWDTLAAVPGDKQTGERGHIEDMFLEFLCALLVFGQMDKNGVCVFIVYRNSIEMMFFWFNLMLSDFQNHTNTRVCVFFCEYRYLSTDLYTYLLYISIFICVYIYVYLSIRPSLYMLLIGIIWFTVSFLVNMPDST
jgi:hypothetical protein